jgi:CBS-domain-containing membrane protein
MKRTTVADVMTRTVVAVLEGAEFKEIVEVMRNAHISALPVLDSEHHVIGVVSEGDLLAKEAKAAGRRAAGPRRRAADEEKADEVLAAGLMTRPAVTIGRDATVPDAASLMSARRVRRLPVVDDWGHLIGIVSRVDVLSVFSREDSEIRDEVTDIVTRKFALDPHTVEISVRSGIVTVTGKVEIQASTPYLLDDIRHVEAVVDVRDRLSYPHEDHCDNAEFFAVSSVQPVQA